MDIKEIQALAKILDSKGLTAIEVCEGENMIRLERAPTAGVYVSDGGNRGVVSQDSQVGLHAAPSSSGLNFNQSSDSDDQSDDSKDYMKIVSPMVGVYYSAFSPDADPFVTVGSKIKKGDILCIIEAMKLMNEIHAEYDGEIMDVCVKNGDVVEFSQVLFKIV